MHLLGGMNLYDRIVERLTHPQGGVVVATMTRSTTYTHKHLNLFERPTKASEQETGVYVKRGKRRDYVDERYVAVRFGFFKETK